MGSTSLVAVKDKSSEPELEGNIRTMVWDSASARKPSRVKMTKYHPETSLRRSANYQQFR
jgi:hypothetical protein